MNATNNIATDLFYKIRSRFSGLKLGSEEGKITIDPEEARFFDFDYTDDTELIGHVSISLAEENSMKVYFSSGITDDMTSVQKEKWYGFLKELRQFAKRRLMAFDTRDIAKDNLDRRDYAFLIKTAKPNKKQKQVGESIMNENSSLYGTKRVSYQKLMDTKLIIKHTNPLLDDQQRGARSRNISAIFIENRDGERFKYPYIHLAGARAMQRHVANSGTPYDDIGRSITQMSEEISQLRKFSNYVSRNHLLNDDTNNIIEYSGHALAKLREQVARLSKQRSYDEYTESFYLQPKIDVPQEVIQEYTEKFTIKNFKEDIKTVFPILYRLMQENSTIGYNDIVSMTATPERKIQETIKPRNEFDRFEDWVMTLGEDTSITGNNEENRDMAISNLQLLVGQHFPAGIKGKNAITSLDGIINDPGLIMQLKGQALMDPDLDVRPLIHLWLEANAPDILSKLDFGDMVEGEEGEEAPPAEGEEEMPPAEGEEMPPAEGEEGPPPMQQESFMSDFFGKMSGNSSRMKDKISSFDRGSKKSKDAFDSNDMTTRSARNTGSVDTNAVSNFIFSFYDTETRAFPKGPESVCTMVGKKFGEQAETVARRLVYRLAPEQNIIGTTMRESKYNRKTQLHESVYKTEIDVPCHIDGEDMDTSEVEIDYNVYHDEDDNGNPRQEIEYNSVTCVHTGEDLIDEFYNLPDSVIGDIEDDILADYKRQRDEDFAEPDEPDDSNWNRYESRASRGNQLAESVQRKPMLTESAKARQSDIAALKRIKTLSGLSK